MSRTTQQNTAWVSMIALVIAATAVFGAFAFVGVSPASAWHCQLSVDKALIEEGEQVKLSWSYSYPDKFSIDNGVGIITVNNSYKMVSPTETTTYTGTVTDSKNRTARCTVTVNVKPPVKPTCEMTATDSEIKKGESTTVRWSSTNAVSATISGIGGVDVNGAKSISPTSDTTYTGTFKNKKGEQVTCSVLVTVKEVEQKVPACFMGSDDAWPKHLEEGKSTKIWWRTDNAPTGSYLKLEERKPLTTEVWKTYTGTFSTTGEMTVTPTRDTDYFGVVYDKNGNKIDDCMTEIDLIKKVNKTPTCDLTINKPRVTQGRAEEVTITWDTTNITSGSFNHGIGSVGPSGSLTFTPNQNEEYVGDFTGPYGDVQCKTRVEVIVPQCFTCGGENTPSVYLYQKYEPATSTPLAFVSLSQVPYTGFEAGPIATGLFWAIIALWSIGLGYSMLVNGSWQTMFAGVIPSPYTKEITSVYGGNGSSSTDSSSESKNTRMHARGAPPANLPGAETPTQIREVRPSMRDMRFPESNGRNPITVMIEEMAHNEKILVSLEAVDSIAHMANRSVENVPGIMQELIQKSKDNFPRVDGWIHITREKVHGMFGAPQKPVIASAEVAQAPSQKAPTFEIEHEVAYVAPVQKVAPAMPSTSAPVVAPISTSTHTSQVSEPAHSVGQVLTSSPRGAAPAGAFMDSAQFITWVTSGAEEQAFKMLRTHLAQGGSVQSLFAEIANNVDAAYRSRIEGGRADSRIVERFQNWKAEDIEGFLSILSGGLDYSYSTPQTAGKITLAKLFEFTRSRSIRA